MFPQFKYLAIYSTLCFALLFTLPVFSSVGQISNQELQSMIKEQAILIDIRLHEEWLETGVIEGSHLLTFFDAKGQYNVKKWLQQFQKIVSKDKPFVLICRSGNRTGIVSDFLDKSLKLKQVNHLSQGIKSWIKYGFKVVKVDK